VKFEISILTTRIYVRMRKIWHDGKKGLAWIDQAMDKHSDPFKEPRGHSLGITK